MGDQLVRIESGLGNGLLLGISTASPPSGFRARCVTAKLNDANGTTWAIHELTRSSAFYLVHVATAWVCVFGADGNGIYLADQQNAFAAGDNLGQIITTDDTGAGLVAINNYRHSMVFDVRGSNTAFGTNVIPSQWLSGDNQRWRMNPLD